MPRLEIYLQKIRHNTRTVVQMCKQKGIDVVGVTKGVSGMPEVAKAMLDGGVCGLADARLRNITKLRSAGIDAPIMLLRLPRLSRAASVVKLTDSSLNSEWSAIRSLAKESRKIRKPYGIILMVDVGDLREGIMFHHVLRSIRRNIAITKMHLHGIGTNVGCYGGVLPSEKNMGILAQIAGDIEKQFSMPLSVISVGGTNCLPMVEKGMMAPRINQIRIGEAILLGRDSSRNAVVKDTYQDAFVLATEIVEIKDKPSEPIGTIGRDAFGKVPVFKDKGLRRRALVALGKQDVRFAGLIPTDPGMKILGGSSDYLISDITESGVNYRVGDEVRFHLLYAGLVTVSISPYVNRVFKEDIK